MTTTFELFAFKKPANFRDAQAAVGHGQAFGLFVNLRHTRDIKRESGGGDFARTPWFNA